MSTSSEFSQYALQKLTFPIEEEKYLKFDNYKMMLTAPIMIYTDLECFVTTIQSCELDPSKSSTVHIHLDTPPGYCYMIVSQDQQRNKLTIMYHGPNVIEHLGAALLEEAEDIENQLQEPILMYIRLEDQTKFCNATTCYFCQKQLVNEYIHVIHDHLTRSRF